MIFASPVPAACDCIIATTVMTCPLWFYKKKYYQYFILALEFSHNMTIPYDTVKVFIQ